MNRIRYIADDNWVEIDGVKQSGDYNKPENVWAITWDAPDKLWIEYRDHSTSTTRGVYPYQQHLDQWASFKVVEEEMIAAEAADRAQEQKEREEKAAQRQEAKDALKIKIGLVFQEAGYSLDVDELHLMFGEELECQK